LKTFSDLGLAESLLRAVTAEGYETPTPIQAEVVPLLLEGRDVLGIAQTGTGKTASFVLPLLHRIASGERNRAPKTCEVLILTPTRELASQIADEIQRYSRFMQVSVALVVGGVRPGPQVRTLSRGVDIIVATPGRLLDHASSGVVSFGKTRAVVLDEADQMLDLGFLPAIRRIMSALPKRRQTILMSATMPKAIGQLAAQFLDNPEKVSVTPVSRPIERIAQSVIPVEAANKRNVLADILSGETVERAIVFTRTKHGADKVKRHLENAGLPAAAIHGNKSQGQRERALEAFRDGSAPILVATDIAARGIHVDDVSHVINFELPEVAEVYVHRIGRTARAGQSGVAISLCDPAERKLLRAIERLTGMTLAAGATRSGTTSAPVAADIGERRGAPKRQAPQPAQRDAASRPDNKGRRRNRPRRSASANSTHPFKPREKGRSSGVPADAS